MATDVWTHVGFARVATLLGARAGLRFPPSRQPSTEQAIRRVLADMGVRDPHQFAGECLLGILRRDEMHAF